jgi:hypothetical protein
MLTTTPFLFLLVLVPWITSLQIKQQIDDAAAVVNVLDIENQRLPFTLLVNSMGLLPHG